MAVAAFRHGCAAMLAATLLLLPGQAMAQKPAMIESDGGLKNTGKQPGAKAGAVVNGTAGAYSEDTVPVLGTVKNTIVSTQYTSGTPPTTLTTMNMLQFPTPKEGNVIGYGDVRLKTVPSSMVATSSVVFKPVNPTAKGTGEWTLQAGAANASLEASAFVAKNLPAGVTAAFAAGFANDPYTVAAGTHTFSPVLDGGLLLQTDGSPRSQAAQLYVEDTPGLTTPGGTGLTTPHLWSLLITLNSSDPVVNFQGDPILMSALGLTDQQMDTRIQGALNLLTPDEVTLKSQYLTTGFTLFDTMLTSKTDYTFSDSVAASASSTPEPNSLVLLVTGCAAWAGFHLYRKAVRRDLGVRP
jgi:hypothetical protein